VAPGSAPTAPNAGGIDNPPDLPTAPLDSAFEFASTAIKALTHSLDRLSCATCVGVHSPSPAQAVATPGFSLQHLIQSVDAGLSGLPDNPVADVLSGALWLVRRNVVSSGSDVGPWGSAACVVAEGCSGHDVTAADLLSADLARATLTGATMTWAALTGMPLTGEDLTDAFLVLVYLALGYLALASLTGSTLTGPDPKRKLAYGNLTGEALSGADLKWPSLYLDPMTADADGAQLTGIAWASTTNSHGSATDTGLPAASQLVTQGRRGPLIDIAYWIGGPPSVLRSPSAA